MKVRNISSFGCKAFIEGESIETKVERIMVNKEPINDSTELIYTERKDGVLPAYDIRTDRMDIAIEAMGTVSKDYIAKRAARINPTVNDEVTE